MQWPEGFKGRNEYRNWTTQRSEHPISFVMSEKGVLISYVEVVWKYLKHNGKKYRVYGLTGVFTYPSFRGRGYSLRLVREAKKYIESSRADIVMFNSYLKGFYEKAGFEKVDSVVTLVGDPSKPTRAEQAAYMLFLSQKGKRGRADFENTPVYFGEDTW